MKIQKNGAFILFYVKKSNNLTFLNKKIKIISKERKMFVDTHAHLTDKAFKENLNQIIEKANDSMVKEIITSGFDLSSSVEAVELAGQYDNIYASIGFYPEYADDFSKEIEDKIEKLGGNQKVVAIGEIGLQYTDGMPSHERQKEVFLRQIKLAKRLNKPIIIHCRDAYGDMITLLKDNKEYLTSGTLHCYSGSYEIAVEAIKLGFYISVGGVSTFKNAQNVREMLKKVPLDRMILETDCPYLTPHPYRGQLNMPSFIPTIAQSLAQLKGVDIQTVADTTTINARRLFKI